MPSSSQKRAAPQRRAAIEPLEGRLLCRIVINGEFVIAPPGGGQAFETVKQHPAEGVTGLNTAQANSNGVVNWEKTSEHEWTPGDQGGPRGA